MVSLHRSLPVLFVAAALVLSGCTAGGGEAPETTASVVRATASSPGPATESATASSTPTPTPTPTPEPVELPRGGMEIFPDYRLVGYSGHPHAPAMGRLGIGNLGCTGRIPPMKRFVAIWTPPGATMRCCC
ncbi:hypothetical protein [Arthrobacter roseus]|uniref:hypothetical protein n=1 Tax=Arthrobacter roseus TaxID=136274 RepID=UPI001962D86A|nr:hypothetical protein [Arthrobacter roseus]MBM7846895.1 putative small secreted protein [Arthrobacter roseus]